MTTILITEINVIFFLVIWWLLDSEDTVRTLRFQGDLAHKVVGTILWIFHLTAIILGLILIEGLIL